LKQKKLKDSSKISEELLETIERYLNGSLSSQELKDFNRLLDIDEDFKAQVDDVRTMLFGIKAQSLKEQLNEFDEDDLKEKTITHSPKQKARYLRYSRIAVAAAIFIAVGSIWFFSTPQNEKIYANYFKPAQGLSITKGGNNDKFDDAMANYNLGDYKTAIDELKTLAKEKTENDTLNYYLGVACLANKKEAAAIPYLEHVVQSEKPFSLRSDAYYYLALSYLKKGNIELAKKNLAKSNNDTAKEVLLKLTY